FQAEDGIRDRNVTGVQTCALPICIDEVAPELGKLLAPRVMEALGTPLEAYGKAAIVGLNGEIEHGSALIHTLKFGNFFRDAASEIGRASCRERGEISAGGEP